MHCPRCQSECIPGMRFCNHCGSSLAPICAACGLENPTDSAFCGGCGRALWSGAPEPDTAPPVDDRGAPEAENRQLTVMFCDLVGSTRLSGRLDAEDFREAVSAFQQASGLVIQRLGGQVAQYLGDGLLVYFGYPRAHEDDAARAVHAGLEVLRSLPDVNERLSAELPLLREFPLEARIGVHTGPVVIGEMGGEVHREQLALGDTVNLAARLLDVAEAGSLVVSDATAHLVEGRFELGEPCDCSLRGIADSVRVSAVLRSTGVQDRLALGATLGLTPLVGREQEIALLRNRWEQAQEGHGQVVFLMGDAGMGKSRLVQALRERLSIGAHRWRECGGSAFHEATALHPFAELLRAELVLDAASGRAEDASARLEKALEPIAMPLAESFPLFAGLLDLPLPASLADRGDTPEVRRRKTLELLVAWLLRTGEGEPSVLVVEDLHWFDPSSAEVLELLIEQIPTSPLLVLVTTRPGIELPAVGRSHVAHLMLDSLTHKQIDSMIERVAHGKSLPLEVVQNIASKTDGIPLFVEELTKTLLESDLLVESDRRYERADPLPELAIPSTLQDSLTARLDRLGASKEIAQLASVFGREFPRDLLGAVSTLSDDALETALDDLVQAELVYRRGLSGRVVYTFKHALVQEAAYQSLLRRRRQEFHLRIAHALEQQFGGRPEARPELLARHYEEAGELSVAVDLYRHASEDAARRSAQREAIHHGEHGLSLVARLPEGRDRDEQELRLQVALGAPLLEAGGYGDAGVQRAYARAHELCQRLGDAPERFRVLWGLSVFYQARNDLETAVELGEELLELAERSGDESLVIMANMSLGSPLYWMGHFVRSLDHVERAMHLGDASRHRALAPAYGEDPAISSRVYGALGLWQRGQIDRALARIEDAVSLGQEGSHPFSLGYALCFSAALHGLSGDRETARTRAREAVAVSERQLLSLWLGFGRFLHGWARGRSAEGGGSQVLELGLAELARTGTEVGAPVLFGILASVYRDENRREDALRVVDEGIALVERRGCRFWNGELHSLRGELLGDRDGEESERAFRRALDECREMGSPTLELRAALRYARFLRERGRADEAAPLLRQAYASFSEGFDTADLRAARSLLAETDAR